MAAVGDMYCEGDEDAAFVDVTPCSSCGRNFNSQVLSRHLPICMKTKNKPRTMFNAARQRAEGTEIPMPSKTNTKTQSKQTPQKTSNWRVQHSEFVNTIRMARSTQNAIAAGKPLPPPPPPAANPDAALRTKVYKKCATSSMSAPSSNHRALSGTECGRQVAAMRRLPTQHGSTNELKSSQLSATEVLERRSQRNATSLECVAVAKVQPVHGAMVKSQLVLKGDQEQKGHQVQEVHQVFEGHQLQIDPPVQKVHQVHKVRPVQESHRVQEGHPVQESHLVQECHPAQKVHQLQEGHQVQESHPVQKVCSGHTSQQTSDVMIANHARLQKMLSVQSGAMMLMQPMAPAFVMSTPLVSTGKRAISSAEHELLKKISICKMQEVTPHKTSSYETQRLEAQLYVTRKLKADNKRQRLELEKAHLAVEIAILERKVALFAKRRQCISSRLCISSA